MSVVGRTGLVYVGCYTTADRAGRGDGISAFRMAADSGELQELGVVARVANPSFLTVHPNRSFVYAVHGGLMSDVSAYEITDRDTGQLKQLGMWSSGGVNPVHLDLDATGRWLVVANYTGGSVAVLPVGPDGCLGEISQRIELSGPRGPDPVEQASPHPHDTPFDPSGTFVVVPDKALDRVFGFRLDSSSGRLVAADPPFAKSAPGAGPRHAAFHPTQGWVYVINELNSTISAYGYKSGGEGIRELQTISSLPSDVRVRSTGSEILVHPSGRFVYVSNRGHNSVGAFGVADDGSLTPIGWYPTHGDTPRAIALDPAGRFLYAANQASDTIVGFRVDERTGHLSATGQVLSTGSPSTILFVGP